MIVMNVKYIKPFCALCIAIPIAFQRLQLNQSRRNFIFMPAIT